MTETVAATLERLAKKRVDLMRDLKAISTEQEFAEVLAGMPVEYRADLDAAGITQPE